MPPPARPTREELDRALEWCFERACETIGRDSIARVMLPMTLPAGVPDVMVCRVVEAFATSHAAHQWIFERNLDAVGHEAFGKVTMPDGAPDRYGCRVAWAVLEALREARVRVRELEQECASLAVRFEKSEQGMVAAQKRAAAQEENVAAGCKARMKVNEELTRAEASVRELTEKLSAVRVELGREQTARKDEAQRFAATAERQQRRIVRLLRLAEANFHAAVQED